MAAHFEYAEFESFPFNASLQVFAAGIYFFGKCCRCEVLTGDRKMFYFP